MLQSLAAAINLDMCDILQHKTTIKQYVL